MQTAETVEAIVSQLMEKQRVARQAALVKQLECGCPDSTCADGKSCSHPMRRITSAKDVASPLPSSSANSRPPSRADNNNQVSSTTGTGSMLLTNNNSPRVYSRRYEKLDTYYSHRLADLCILIAILGIITVRIIALQIQQLLLLWS